MKLHHTRHHQAYVNGLNAAEKAYAESTSTRQQIALQSALKFNGGGGWVLRALRVPLPLFFLFFWVFFFSFVPVRSG